MAIYNFGMRGKEHLEHLLGDNSLSYEKTEAFKKIIDWVTDKGLDVDVVDVYNEFRVLLDVNRDKESTKPKLYELDTYSAPFDGGHAIVLAFDEIEARVIASERDDRFLESSSCDVVDTSKVGNVLYYMEC